MASNFGLTLSLDQVNMMLAAIPQYLTTLDGTMMGQNPYRGPLQNLCLTMLTAIQTPAVSYLIPIISPQVIPTANALADYRSDVYDKNQSVLAGQVLFMFFQNNALTGYSDPSYLESSLGNQGY